MSRQKGTSRASDESVNCRVLDVTCHVVSESFLYHFLFYIILYNTHISHVSFYTSFLRLELLSVNAAHRQCTITAYLVLGVQSEPRVNLLYRD